MDSHSINKLIIFAVCMKVEVESIAKIPKTLCFKKMEVSTLLVVEVESPVCLVQEDLNAGGSVIPNRVVRDNPLGQCEPLITSNLDHSFRVYPNGIGGMG